MGRMILELDWVESSERWEKARSNQDFYTITRDGEDKFGNSKYSITNEKNGKEYALYHSENYQFCTCPDFIFRGKQNLTPCLHLWVLRWFLQARENANERVEAQKTYRVQPSEAFFRLQALKEQLQKDVRENGGGR